MAAELIYNPRNDPQKFDFKSIKTGEPITFSYIADDTFKIINHNDIKVNLLIKAIGNLLKKNEFLQLYIQMIDGQISEEEYEVELQENSDKYFISMEPIANEEQFEVLIKIVRDFPKQLSLDECSEIFGISNEHIINQRING